MKCLPLFIFFFHLYLGNPVKAQSNVFRGITYLSPKPSSKDNSVQTNIILRFTHSIDQNLIKENLIQVRSNGEIFPFHIVQQSDRQKLILQPNAKLPANSAIDVIAEKGIPLEEVGFIPTFQFTFFTHKEASFPMAMNEEYVNNKIKNRALNSVKEAIDETDRTIENDLSKQLSFTMHKKGDSNDFYFVASMFSNKERLMIVNGKGDIVFDRRTPYMSLDFKMHADSTYSFVNLAADPKDYGIILLDKNFKEKDTLYAGNGYNLDIHELVIDHSTGNYFILATREIIVDMNAINGNGYSNARVLDLIIQELDSNNNVLFEWKCFDHLPITDAVGVELNTTQLIDYVHCNGIMLDTDSTLLLSSRHLNEVTRINRKNGEIIWRLGPNPSSHRFTFPNDSGAFTYQHHAQRLANGHILLFDNGNFKKGPRYSRAVEYALDEELMVATKVWEYRPEPEIVSNFMGSVQRLENGHTLIGWGSASPTFTEVDSNNQVVCEGSFGNNILNYRAFKYRIPGIIAAHQPKFTLAPNPTLCKLNDPEFDAKFKNSLQSYMDPNIPQEFQLVSLNNNKLKVIQEDTLSHFYSFETRNLDVKTARLPTQDTTLCEGVGNFQISVADNCGGSTYHWSTGATTPHLNYTTTPNLNKLWLQINNGAYTQTDTLMVKVSPVGPFEIIGEPVLNKPYQIFTYSVPYFKNVQYNWKAINGNIISGFETNAVQVQWGDKAHSYLQGYITDLLGCTNSTGWDTIFYKQTNTGAEELRLLDGFKVFPSPFTNEIHVEGNKPYSYMLFDISGKIVSEEKTSINKPTAIQTDQYPSGIYLLHITTEDKQIHYKLIKN